MQDLSRKLFELSEDVRYVAVYRDKDLTLRQRPALAGASSSESDRYEELLVNPTLIALTRQRGDIDCGGLEYVLIRYGGFYQLVQPIGGGHVSVAIEPLEDPMPVVRLVRTAILKADASAARRP